jgi:hypothetical protein
LAGTFRKGTVGGVARVATNSRRNSPSARSSLRPTNKLRELLQKLIAPDTRNAMTISVALNAPIDHLHHGVFRM